MQIVHWILLAFGLALFAWSAVRWKSCAVSHPEYGARREMMLLFGLLIAGVGGDAIRARFPDGSTGFVVSSIALVPLALAALVILFRMISVYRRTPQPNSKAHPLGDRPRGRRE